MGRQRMSEAERTLCEMNEDKITMVNKTDYKHTIRVYTREGEFKIIKDKRSFVTNEKNYMKVYDKWCEIYSDYIVELLNMECEVLRTNEVE